MKSLNNYEVVVGNVGVVSVGGNLKRQLPVYNHYVKMSKDGVGSCAGESVTLYKNGKIERTYSGAIDLQGVIEKARERGRIAQLEKENGLLTRQVESLLSEIQGLRERLTSHVSIIEFSAHVTDDSVKGDS